MRQETAIQQLLARYVRAADARDGKAIAGLFAAEARIEVLCRGAGGTELVVRFEGADSIATGMADVLPPHAPRGWSHHTTHDLLIDAKGEAATLDAQFITFETLADQRPAYGWPVDASGPQGVVRSTEAGYYRANLVCVENIWKMTALQIIHDLPIVPIGR